MGRPVVEGQECLRVVVVGSVGTMAMHGPEKIFCEAVRMRVLGNHLHVV